MSPGKIGRVSSSPLIGPLLGRLALSPSPPIGPLGRFVLFRLFVFLGPLLVFFVTPDFFEFVPQRSRIRTDTRIMWTNHFLIVWHVNGHRRRWVQYNSGRCSMFRPEMIRRKVSEKGKQSRNTGGRTTMTMWNNYWLQKNEFAINHPVSDEYVPACTIHNTCNQQSCIQSFKTKIIVVWSSTVVR